MTLAEKITVLSGMMDGDETNETLTAYLRVAEELILNILYPTESNREHLAVPDRYSMNQIQIAAYLISKRGAEGETQRTENGIRHHWGSADVPEAMIKHITPFCGVVK